MNRRTLQERELEGSTSHSRVQKGLPKQPRNGIKKKGNPTADNAGEIAVSTNSTSVMIKPPRKSATDAQRLGNFALELRRRIANYGLTRPQVGQLLNMR